jgi:hypothetical protein
MEREIGRENSDTGRKRRRDIQSKKYLKKLQQGSILSEDSGYFKCDRNMFDICNFSERQVREMCSD